MVRSVRVGILLLLCWTYLVCYPLPWQLAVSLHRVIWPPVAADQVAELADSIDSDDPVVIEAVVLAYVPYQYDWVTYSMPWYFPTPREVLMRGGGDCKSRFVVLASVLEYKGVPYKQRVSSLHVWVDYEGKPVRDIELAEQSFIVRDDTGLSMQRGSIDFQRWWDLMRQTGWDAMPEQRRWLLVGGWICIIGRLGFHTVFIRRREPS